MKFYKYHALGNDYIVMNPEEIGRQLTESEIITICHRNFGIGSDGILWGPTDSNECDFGLRIYNPDGSEAEKSGNGLRIFSRYLYDQGLAADKPFTIMTPGGKVRCEIQAGGKLIEVEMGKVSFHSDDIPVIGNPREVINESIQVGDATFLFCAATIGNPHCVIPLDDISEELARTYGPMLETESRFPNRTNVQFLKVLDRNNIQLEIWERGAGYTLASGSSSSAAASVAFKLGLCDDDITVHSPGGVLQIKIGDDYAITMTGPVTHVGQGTIAEDVFTQN